MLFVSYIRIYSYRVQKVGYNSGVWLRWTLTGHTSVPFQFSFGKTARFIFVGYVCLFVQPITRNYSRCCIEWHALIVCLEQKNIEDVNNMNTLRCGKVTCPSVAVARLPLTLGINELCRFAYLIFGEK